MPRKLNNKLTSHLDDDNNHIQWEVTDPHRFMEVLAGIGVVLSDFHTKKKDDIVTEDADFEIIEPKQLPPNDRGKDKSDPC